MEMFTLDTATMYGMGGQLVGHGVVWGKQVASGKRITDILTPETLFWAAFSILSETLTSQATSLLGTSTAGIAAPAAVQIAVLNMYNENTKQTIPRLMSGEIAAVLDNASISGTIGAVLAKSYAP
jgi:hypothetical protein